MKNVIVSGSTGFIGQHLTHHLKDDGFTIYSLNRRELESEDHGFFAPEFSTSADTLVYLIGAAHKKFSDEDAYHINYVLTKKVIERAVTLGFKRLIFVSTVNVYVNTGRPLTPSSPLNTSQLENTTYYKLFAEKYVKELGAENKIEYVIISSPLVYGRGVKANFSALMKLVGKKLPLPFGAINANKRSLVSVYNLVDLIKVCIEHPKATNQTFFVSDGDDLSTTSMVKLMAEVQGIKPLLIPLPVWSLKILGKLTGKSDMISRLTDSLRVDITHTQETLNWTPPFSVKEGFTKCIENKDV